MLLHQLSQPVVCAMHPHLERGHRRARDPGDLFVRQPFHVLQHEDLALLRGQVLERPALTPARAPPARTRRPAGRAPRTFRPSNRAAAQFAAGAAAPRSNGSARSGTATPQTCPARDSPPADQTPAPAHPAPHPRRRPGSRACATRNARSDRDSAPPRRHSARRRPPAPPARPPRPSPRPRDPPEPPPPEVMQEMVEDRGVAGNHSQPKESPPAPLVTLCPVSISGRERYLAPVSTVFMASCPPNARARPQAARADHDDRGGRMVKRLLGWR